MKRLWNSLHGLTPQRSNSRRQATFRPRIEALEERRLMSRGNIAIVEMELDGEEMDVLKIHGTEYGDRIDIRYRDAASPQNGIEVTIRDKENNNRLLNQGTYDGDDLDEFEAIYVYGWGGNDTIHNYVDIPSWQNGGSGNDSLFGGPENDTLIGGPDNDSYIFVTHGPDGEELGHDTIIEEGNAGNDVLSFGGLDWGITLDLASAGEQIVIADHLRLTLTGAQNLEQVAGTSFDDILWGNDAANRFDTGDGNDTLEGRGGDDDLRGGGDDDTYVFADSANLGTDTVTEWPDADTDALDFSGFQRAITLDIGWTAPQTAQVVSSGYILLVERAVAAIAGRSEPLEIDRTEEDGGLFVDTIVTPWVAAVAALGPAGASAVEWSRAYEAQEKQQPEWSKTDHLGLLTKFIGVCQKAKEAGLDLVMVWLLPA